MKLKIGKEAGIPLYLQIKEQIKRQIKMGILVPGEQLPTERELAEELGVSRNTVSMAFKELEQEGVLVIGQGKGTFVTGGEKKNPVQQVLAANRKEKALLLIDLAIDECLDMGFSIEQFIALTTVRAREKEDSLMKARILFIDCNQEQLQNFVNHFREVVHLDIIPLLLEEFISGGTRIEKLLAQTDLIITTAAHLEEVGRKLIDLNIKLEVVPVATQPRMASLIRLSRLAGNKNIGLVCLSPQFAKVVQRSLARIGIFDLQLDFTVSSDPDVLEEFIAEHEVLLVFSKRYNELKKLAGDKEVISYEHELDLGSVTLVRKAIERVLRNKRKEEEP